MVDFIMSMEQCLNKLKKVTVKDAKREGENIYERELEKKIKSVRMECFGMCDGSFSNAGDKK